MQKYNRQSLHQRAAEYYHLTATSSKSITHISDIENYLAEFEHLVKSEAYDSACKLLNKLDSDYLQRWGFSYRVIQMRGTITGKINSPRLQVFHHLSLGRARMNLGDTNNAIKDFELALKLSKDLGGREAKFRESMLLDSLGIAHRSLGQLDEAVRFHQEALVIADEIGDNRSKGIRLHNLGIAHTVRGEVDIALNYHKNALEVSRQEDDIIGTSIRLGTLGLLYREMGKTDEAISSLTEALNLSREKDYKRGTAISLGALGDCYRDLGEFNKALELYQESLGLTRESHDISGQALELRNIAQIYLLQNLLLDATKLIEDAWILSSEIADVRTLYNTGITYGLILLWQNQEEKALKIFTSLLKYKMPEFDYQLYTLFALAYLRSSDHHKAIEFTRTAMNLTEVYRNKKTIYYQIQYTHAFLHLILAVLSDDELRSEKLLQQSLSIYRSATNDFAQKGIRLEFLQMLQLIPQANEAQLKPILRLFDK